MRTKTLALEVISAHELGETASAIGSLGVSIALYARALYTAQFEAASMLIEDLPIQARILDLGANSGGFSRCVRAALARDDFSFVWIDSDADAMAVGSQEDAFRGHVRTHVADLSDDGTLRLVGDNTVDLALAGLIQHYLPPLDYRRMVRDVFRKKLKHGGVLLLAELAPSSFPSLPVTTDESEFIQALLDAVPPEGTHLHLSPVTLEIPLELRETKESWHPRYIVVAVKKTAD